MSSEHFFVVKCEHLTMQPLFLSLEMGNTPILDDRKFNMVIVKCERSL